jgi:hypothetical protein
VEYHCFHRAKSCRFKAETVNTNSIAARSHEAERESMSRQERERRQGDAFGELALLGVLGALSGSTWLVL